MLNSFILICLLSLSAGADDYWEAQDNSLLGQFGIYGTSLSFEIQPTTGGKNLKFQPNGGGKLWYGLSYGDFGVSYGFTQNTTPESDALYGASSGTDFQFHFYFTSYIVEAYYQNYRGYYLENQADVDPSFSANNPRFSVPKLESGHLGLSLTYIFNRDEFSAAAAFSQTSRQLRSAGSWLVTTGLSSHQIRTDQSIIPSFVSGQYGEIENLRTGYMHSLSVGGGYGHVFTLYNYYVSLLLMINLSEQLQNLTYTSKSEDKWMGNSQSSIKLGAGYNGKNFVAGVGLNAFSTSVPIDKVNVSVTSLDLLFAIGYRWDNIKLW